MAAGKLDLLIEQGADFERILTLESPEDAPLNLTGYAFAGSIRRKYSDTKSAANFQVQIYDQTVPENLGKLKIFISNENTKSIAVDAATDVRRKNTLYVYDLEMTKPGGTKERVLEGYVEVSPEVTR